LVSILSFSNIPSIVQIFDTNVLNLLGGDELQLKSHGDWGIPLEQIVAELFINNILSIF